jgi:hypothetical protein
LGSKCQKIIPEIAKGNMDKSTARVAKFRLNNPWHRPLEYAKRRCSDPKHREFSRYGGRGIKCFLTKQQAIELFIRDQAHLLERPSLDRIDPDGHYSFENCRFIEWRDNIAGHRKKIITEWEE